MYQQDHSESKRSTYRTGLLCTFCFNKDLLVSCIREELNLNAHLPQPYFTQSQIMITVRS